MTSNLESVRRKVESGELMSPAEGEALFDPLVDLHALGELADAVRRRKHGDVAYYNVNAHLNPTNICTYRCPLCAYSRDPGDPMAYAMTRDEILQRGGEAAASGATELHIVGGVHPDKGFDWYLGILSSLHAAYPRLHLKAWTPVEIARFVQVTGLSIRDVLRELVAAGLGSLPGGGAEIFHPDVRRRIAPLKADAATWLEVHRTAHEMGLRSNATMLYGHLETPAHRVDHLLRLRELQDATGGFQAFIPLAFHPDGTQLGGTQLGGPPLGGPQLGGTQLGGRPATDPLSRSGRGAGGEGALRSEQEDVVGRSPRPLVTRRPTALEDLRVMAVSRLFLDNFDHVKAYWISLGVGTAQVALCYGADDLDGTVRHEAIHHEAGSEGPESLSVEELCALIREAGREPIERDTLYRPVRRSGTHWEVIA